MVESGQIAIINTEKVRGADPHGSGAISYFKNYSDMSTIQNMLGGIPLYVLDIRNGSWWLAYNPTFAIRWTSVEGSQVEQAIVGKKYPFDLLDAVRSNSAHVGWVPREALELYVGEPLGPEWIWIDEDFRNKTVLEQHIHQLWVRSQYYKLYVVKGEANGNQASQ